MTDENTEENGPQDRPGDEWLDVPSGDDVEGSPGSGDDHGTESGSGDGDPERTVSIDAGDGGESLSPKRERSRANRALTWILALALLASLAGVVYVAVTPQATGEPFTEFYVLGPEGNASGYPTELAPGETGEVIVGVSNHERRSLDYRVTVSWDGTATRRQTVTVPDGETRERRLTLTAPDAPGEYRVRIVLAKLNGSPRPYRTLRLLVTVNGTGAVVERPARDR